MIDDGKTQQSARLFFINKDHKDIYGNLPTGVQGQSYTGFHHALYLKDADAKHHDVIWHKMFPDLRFYYKGGNPQASVGLCYPKANVTSGLLPLFNWQGGAFTDERIVYKVYNELFVSTKDGRIFFPLEGFDLPTSNYDLVLGGAKGGFIYRVNSGSEYEYYFIKLDVDGKVDSETSIITRPTMTMFNNAYSNQIVFADYYQSNYVWHIFNTDTLTLHTVGRDWHYNTSMTFGGEVYGTDGLVMGAAVYSEESNHWLGEALIFKNNAVTIQPLGIVANAGLTVMVKAIDSGYVTFWHDENQVLHCAVGALGSQSVVSLPTSAMFDSLDGQSQIEIATTKAYGDLHNIPYILASDFYYGYRDNGNCFYLNNKRVKKPSGIILYKNNNVLYSEKYDFTGQKLFFDWRNDNNKGSMFEKYYPQEDE